MKLLTVLFSLLMSYAATGDVIRLKGGASIDVTVVQETPTSVTAIFGCGLLALDKASVVEVERSEASTDPADSTDRNADEPKQPAPRTSTWDAIILHAGLDTDLGEIRQIPATVIDVGILRHVPYKSQRCGDRFEINVYGDPVRPAGFEIGIVDPAAVNDKTKRQCVEFAVAMLGDSTDAAILRALTLEEDKAERRGLTFEVTPPTAADAYGGWWVSVYSEELLESERANEAELAEITASREVEPKELERPSRTRSAAKKSEEKAKSEEHDKAIESLHVWSSDDLKLARPSSSSNASGGSGKVYVRGYYRKDGTYVRPHYRSKPSR